MELSKEFREKFVKRLQGKDFITYPGLLQLAREKAGGELKRLEAKPIQIPSAENEYFAVCVAELETQDGSIFIEVGDACPKNVNKNVVPHILRVAATRAKARALRDYTGVDMVALEEVTDGELDDVLDEPEPASETLKKSVPQKAEKADSSTKSEKVVQINKAGSNGSLPKCIMCNKTVESEKVASFSLARFKRYLCLSCQDKYRKQQASSKEAAN